MSATTLNGTALNGNTPVNAKPTQRKQLADQLDRLDEIIDALGEGLPAAVTDAVREGARLAVKDAIIEIFTNPELRSLLVPATLAAPQPMPGALPETPPVPPEPKRPSLWSRIKAKVGAAKAAVVGAVFGVKDTVVGRCRTARAAINAVGFAGGEGVPVRKISVVSLLVGLIVGFSCLLLPETVAAVIGGLGAATTAFCLQVGSWLRRVACRVGLLV